jgi:hypothetical protein
VLKYLIQVESEFGYRLRTVASQNHYFDQPGHITVGPEPQATDMAIINRLDKHDVVITQDWGLAALVLAKGGKAISPSGLVYRAERMPFMLEQRNLLARYRRGGGHVKGPSARTEGDDLNFQQAFQRLLGVDANN